MTHDAAKKFLSELPGIKHDLPFSPGLMQKLFVQTGSRSMASLGDVAETINKDQGLTAKVLGVANSAFYGLRAEVTSVARAVTVLGMSEIRNIVVAFGIKALTEKFPVPKGFDLLAYWKHQFYVAMIARMLAKKGGDRDADGLFTMGLLHDLGKLITAMYRPEVWQSVEVIRMDEGLSCIEAEDKYWGLDHSVVGAMVLKSWDFPEMLVEPVNWHHSPMQAGDYKVDASFVCMADAMAHKLFDGQGVMSDEAYEALIEDTCEKFGLDRDEIINQSEDILNDESVDHVVHLLA